jgi:hypothetical protein
MSENGEHEVYAVPFGSRLRSETARVISPEMSERRSVNHHIPLRLRALLGFRYISSEKFSAFTASKVWILMTSTLKSWLDRCSGRLK